MMEIEQVYPGKCTIVLANFIAYSRIDKMTAGRLTGTIVSITNKLLQGSAREDDFEQTLTALLLHVTYLLGEPLAHESLLGLRIELEMVRMKANSSEIRRLESQSSELGRAITGFTDAFAAFPNSSKGEAAQATRKAVAGPGSGCTNVLCERCRTKPKSCFKCNGKGKQQCYHCGGYGEVASCQAGSADAAHYNEGNESGATIQQAEGDVVDADFTLGDEVEANWRWHGSWSTDRKVVMSVPNLPFWLVLLSVLVWTI